MIKMESFSFEFFKFQSYYRRKIRKLSRMEATKGAISCPLTCADELICVVWFGDTSEARRHCDKATFSHVTSSCFRLEMSLPRRCAWFLSWIYFLLLLTVLIIRVQNPPIFFRSGAERWSGTRKKQWRNCSKETEALTHYSWRSSTVFRHLFKKNKMQTRYVSKNLRGAERSGAVERSFKK